MTIVAVGWSVLALVAPLLVALAAGQRLRVHGGVVAALGGGVVASGAVLLAGYLAAWLGRLADLSVWALLLGLIAALCGAAAWLAQRRAPLTTDTAGRVVSGARTGRWLLPLLGLTVAGLGLLNLVQVCLLPPHDWDGLVYHLARLAYYIQQGSLDYYDATIWTQVAQPKGSTLLTIYVYLVTARAEPLTQLPAYLGYWLGVAGVFAVALELGGSRRGALVAALWYGLLPSALLVALTSMNDTLIAGFVVVGLALLLAGYRSGAPLPTALAGVSWMIALGMKSSLLLAVPGLALIALVAIWRSREPRPLVLSSALGVVLGAVLFVAPAGYLENLAHYGHPLAPAAARLTHSLEGLPAGERLRQGAVNTLRLAVDMTSLDGLAGPAADQVQQTVRTALIGGLRAVGVDLNDRSVPLNFNPNRPPEGHEGRSLWGLAGLLLWLAVGRALWRGPPLAAAFGGATLLFCGCYACTMPYDEWRGRFLLLGAVTAAPLVALLWDAWVQHRLGAVCLHAAAVVTCAAAVSAVLFRANLPIIEQQVPIPGQVLTFRSTFALDRLDQFAALRVGFGSLIRAYEAAVPPDATVAVATGEGFYEYPLFGAGLTRRLIPISSFEHGLLPMPPEADALIFADSVIAPTPADQLLGEDRYVGRIYLRRLRSTVPVARHRLPAAPATALG